MMKQMRNTTRTTFALVLGALMAAILAIGCSLDSTGVGPAVSSDETATRFSTPSVEEIDVPCPPGREIVSGLTSVYSMNGALDDPSLTGGRPGLNRVPCVSSWVTTEHGGSVFCDYVGVKFEPGCVPEDMIVTACLPFPGYACVKFGPHGAEFNGMAKVVFDISDIDPEDYDEIELWYITDSNGFEGLPVEIDADARMAIGFTNHFSRYILTKPSGGND